MNAAAQYRAEEAERDVIRQAIALRADCHDVDQVWALRDHIADRLNRRRLKDFNVRARLFGKTVPMRRLTIDRRDAPDDEPKEIKPYRDRRSEKRYMGPIHAGEPGGPALNVGKGLPLGEAWDEEREKRLSEGKELVLDHPEQGTEWMPLDAWMATRIRNVFREAGIATIGDVLAMSDADLLRLPNFGRVSLRAVRRCLIEPWTGEAP